MSFRKPRSDSRLKNLPEDKAQTIIKWLLDGMSYQKALLLLEKSPFFIETSERALCEFYQEYCLPVLVERQSRASRLAMGVRKQAEASPTDFNQATIDLLSRWSFEMAAGKTLDPKDVKSIMTLLLKHEDQELKRKQVEVSMRKLSLLEAKTEKVQAVNNSALSAEEKKTRINQIFGKTT